MFVFPHGTSIDAQDNIWVADGQGKDGKGQQVYKFNPDGKVLMTLGKAGVTAILTASSISPPTSPLRLTAISSFPKATTMPIQCARFEVFEGRQIHQVLGSQRLRAIGEFFAPHSLVAIDSHVPSLRWRPLQQPHPDLRSGRQTTRHLEAVRPTDGIYIAKHDTCMSPISDSDSARSRLEDVGIRIGSAKTGKVKYFIPYPGPEPKPGVNGAAESAAAHAHGNVYGADVGDKDLKRT